MTAPAPRMADGKPDLVRALDDRGAQSGRRPRNAASASVPDEAGDQRNITASRQMRDIGVDLPGGLPYQPWLVPIVKERTANEAIDDPHIRCLPDNFLRAYGLPHLLKFVHSPQLLVVLNEMNAGYRQVFTDGRPLPKDPNPSWQGYSSATWSGDTLVIDTIGLRDDTWIDWNGSVLTEAAKVREEIRRPDFGHLEIKVTVDDPKAYTKPWTVTLKQRIVVDAELDRRNLSGKREVREVRRSHQKAALTPRATWPKNRSRERVQRHVPCRRPCCAACARESGALGFGLLHRASRRRAHPSGPSRPPSSPRGRSTPSRCSSVASSASCARCTARCTPSGSSMRYLYSTMSGSTRVNHSVSFRFGLVRGACVEFRRLHDQRIALPAAAPRSPSTTGAPARRGAGCRAE